MKIQVKTADPKYLPTYKTTGAACCDLVARVEKERGVPGMVRLIHRSTVVVPTGIAIAIPDGYKLCIAIRSSLAKRGIICTNSPAQIDSDYRDEVGVVLTNVGREIVDIRDGDRIAQCWIEPVPRIEWQTTQELPPADSNRTGGFGSTGVQ